MEMPDPRSALHDLERLAGRDCGQWRDDFAGHGVDLDCDGIAAGQAALRVALEAGGTHHDVLGRLQPALAALSLPARRRLAALAVGDVARERARGRLLLAVSAFGSGAGAAASA
jgi:hypothetical protein